MISEKEIRRDYVSSDEASDILRVNNSRVRQLLSMGRFSGAFKFADTWLIPRVAVENYTRLKPGKKKGGAGA